VRGWHEVQTPDDAVVADEDDEACVDVATVEDVPDAALLDDAREDAWLDDDDDDWIDEALLEPAEEPPWLFDDDGAAALVPAVPLLPDGRLPARTHSPLSLQTSPGSQSRVVEQ
jgi:hypothetical protein